MKRVLFLSYLFLLVINSFLFCLCYYLNFIFDFDVSILITSVSIFIVIFHFLIIEKSLFSIINLFNGFCILFLYGNVINYILFDVDDFNIYHLMKGSFIPYKDSISSIFLINSGVSLVNLSYLKNLNFGNSKLEIQKAIPQYIKLLFIFFSILATIKFVLELKYINEIGYVNFYMNGLGNLNYYSSLIKYSHTFLLLFYGIILSYYPSRKVFILVSIFYCFLMMLNTLKGARVLFILPFLFSFWFYSKFYARIAISGNLLKLLTIFLIVLFGSQFVKSSRLNEETLNFNLSDLPSIVLKETGSTQKLVAIYLSERNNINSSYPYILEPILYPLFYFKNYDIYKSGHSKELVETRNSLNHKISYFLNPSYYLNGHAVGSSMFAESFQYGFSFFILTMILFGRFLSFIQNLKITSNFIYFSPILFNAAVFAPRDSPFPNTWIIFKIGFLIILFYLIRETLQYSRKNQKV